jgi:Ni,Fe-hydrogenase maturation factor
MILLLAYGNELRGDDGAGLALGEAILETLHALSIPAECLRTPQLLPEHAEGIARRGVDAVVFCDTEDARTSASAKIRIRRLEPDGSASPAGHAFRPETLLAFTRALYGRIPPAWLITIPGWKFDHGSQKSRETETFLQDCSPVAEELLEEIVVTAGTQTESRSVHTLNR